MITVLDHLLPEEREEMAGKRTVDGCETRYLTKRISEELPEKGTAFDTFLALPSLRDTKRVK